MEVKFLEDGIEHGGEEYNEGDIAELPDEKAEKAIEKGIVEKVEDESEETESMGIEDISIREDQLDKIETLKGKLDLDDEDVNEMSEKMFGVGSYKELAASEAKDIIEDMTKEMASKEVDREKAAEEVHSFPSGEQGVMAAQKIEEKDKEQIAREVTGKISKATADKWFYQFRQGGETVTGITYDGVMAIFRKKGNIDIIIEDIWEESDHVHVKVRAVDKARNNSIERVSKEPLDRRFAMRIAQSTAQKKAVRALVPDEAITEMYAKWKKKGED